MKKIGVVIIVLTIFDQITKFFTHNYMQVGETHGIIDDFFHISYVQNRGVAFGMMQGKIPIITIVSVIAAIGIIFYLFKHHKSLPKFQYYSYIFICSGAVGNIIDRIYRGFVVDMFDFRGIWSYVFNVADVYINIGVALMILDMILEYKENKKLKDGGGK